MKKYDFKFSIIMSVYNVEEYLEEAIESVTNQDIGFEKNVQLILINDGSIDNSEEICLKYKEMYPNNIIYKKKKNGGLASAKNKGLSFIKGKYVNFFDADDTLPTNVFREVYGFFERNGICVDFVSIPLVFFGAQSGLHPKYAYMGKTNQIIDLRAKPYNFVLSGASCFYKNEIFDSFRFNENYVGEEDSLLNFTIFLKNPRFGYVCEKGVKYNYRKREKQTSIVDTAKQNPESFKTVLNLLESLIPIDKTLYLYQQEFIIYELRSRLKTIRRDLFQSEDEYNSIINGYIKFIKLLNSDYIVYYSKFCETFAQKMNFLMLGNFDTSILYSKVLTETDVTIQRFEIKDKKIYLDVSYHNFGFSSLNAALLVNGEKVDASESDDFNSPLDEEIGSFISDMTHIKKYIIDTKKSLELQLILFDSNLKQFFPVRKVKVANRLFVNSFNQIHYYDNFKVNFKKRKIRIRRIGNANLSSLKNNVTTILKFIHDNKYFAFSRLFSRITKKYILINDRLDKAGDNGEALFKYINENEPELAKNTYYVISGNCSDYKRLKKYGKVVKTGSLKHKKLFLNASHIYSSHTMKEFYCAYDSKLLSYYRDLLNYKFIWLQHGITKDDISRAANRYIKGIDYVITCTNSEYDEFSQEKYCFDKGQIVLSGFARYDFLKDNSNGKIITIAPTWRRGYGLSEGKKDDFKKTDYYINFSEVLTNKQLLNTLSKKNIVINFVLHPEMANYYDDFKCLESENVKIIEMSKVNYSDIFSDSSLLVTDFSSIFFDFAYLKKPEIFFQFDREYFYKSHYKRGYFDYDKDAFGDVLITSREVVEKILFYINNGFKMEKKYSDLVDRTFKYTDFNNSKRILDLTYFDNKG